MPLNDKQRKKFVAIVRQLKKQKGVAIKQQELNQDIERYKKAQEEILVIKEQNLGLKDVESYADDKVKKLQGIIDELNEYMKILHPEGLLDLGIGSAGKAIVSNG